MRPNSGVQLVCATTRWQHGKRNGLRTAIDERGIKDKSTKIFYSRAHHLFTLLGSVLPAQTKFTLIRAEINLKYSCLFRNNPSDKMTSRAQVVHIQHLLNIQCLNFLILNKVANYQLKFAVGEDVLS